MFLFTNKVQFHSDKHILIKVTKTTAKRGLGARKMNPNFNLSKVEQKNNLLSSFLRTVTVRKPTSQAGRDSGSQSANMKSITSHNLMTQPDTQACMPSWCENYRITATAIDYLKTQPDSQACLSGWCENYSSKSKQTHNLMAQPDTQVVCLADAESALYSRRF